MPNNDVIGIALLDYFNENYKDDIIVKSSITEDDIISLPYLFRTKKQLPKIEKKALSLCKGNVLDVGAGSGCHSIILQDKNINVDAIDVSQGAVSVMLKRGIKATKISFFDVTQKYDTLLFLMNGVGISGTLEGLSLFLTKAKSLLNENGQVLLDSSDISYMFQEEDGSLWIDLNNTYYGEVNYQMKYKNIESKPFNWLFVDFNKLKEVANSIGFKCELIYKGSHFDYLARLAII